jgi:hypothetical protein
LAGAKNGIGIQQRHGKTFTVDPYSFGFSCDDRCFDNTDWIGESRQDTAGSSRVDQYTALTALLFLLSALASYLSIRWANSPGVRQIFDRMADYIFICGLIGISAIAFFFAYEFI